MFWKMIIKKTQDLVENDGVMDRLVNMRLKQDSKEPNSVCLNTLARTHTDSNRRAFSNWVWRAQNPEDPDQTYVRLIEKFSTHSHTANLIEVEKLWAEFAIKQPSFTSEWSGEGSANNTGIKYLETTKEALERLRIERRKNSPVEEMASQMIDDEPEFCAGLSVGNDTAGGSEGFFDLIEQFTLSGPTAGNVLGLPSTTDDATLGLPGPTAAAEKSDSDLLAEYIDQYFIEGMTVYEDDQSKEYTGSAFAAQITPEEEMAMAPNIAKLDEVVADLKEVVCGSSHEEASKAKHQGSACFIFEFTGNVRKLNSDKHLIKRVVGF